MRWRCCPCQAVDRRNRDRVEEQGSSRVFRQRRCKLDSLSLRLDLFSPRPVPLQIEGLLIFTRPRKAIRISVLQIGLEHCGNALDRQSRVYQLCILRMPSSPVWRRFATLRQNRSALACRYSKSTLAQLRHEYTAMVITASGSGMLKLGTLTGRSSE